MKCLTVRNNVVEDTRLEVNLQPFPRVVLGERVWIPLGNKDAPELCDLTVIEPCPLRWAWLNEVKYESFSPALENGNCPECGIAVLGVVASKTAFSTHLNEDKVQWMHPDAGAIPGRLSWSKEDVGVMRTNGGRFIIVSSRGESPRCLIRWRVSKCVEFRHDEEVIVIGKSAGDIMAILNRGQKIWARREGEKCIILRWHEKHQLVIQEVDDLFS